MHSNTVLVVDDSPVDRTMLTAVIEGLGLKCLECADGQEALTILKEQGAFIGLMLLDLNMPLVDGISTLGHCKAHFPGLPVIVISSTEDLDDIHQTQRWGVAEFIPKPFNRTRLESAIWSALGIEEAESIKVSQKA